MDASSNANSTPTAAEKHAKLCSTLCQIIDSINALESSGLNTDTNAHTISSDAIEHILIADEWDCATCGLTYEAMCPQRGLPHRRHLVCVAQNILRLIGRTVGKVCARPAHLSERVDGKVKLRTRRYMIMNPQLFLLTYYFVSLGRTDVDPFVFECASHLLDVLRQLKEYAAREAAAADASYVTSLLKSFYTTWHQYVRHANAQLKPISTVEQRMAKDELIGGTCDAFLAANKVLNTKPDDDNLKLFVSLLHQRLTRLASREQLAQVDDQVKREQQVSPITPSNETPEIQRSNPPLLTDLNTSASESEILPAVQAKAMGPALPPEWYVDETGRSRPMTDSSESKKREYYKQQEFKAKKAYEAAMGVAPSKSMDEQLRGLITVAVGDAQLTTLASQLNATPPVLTLIPNMLHLVERSLLETIPRIRARLEQEFRDVLDWRMMSHSTEANTHNIVNLVRFISQKACEYGAPVREKPTRQEADDACRNVLSATPDYGTAVANAFRFLFHTLCTLREDITHFSLLLVNEQLKANAVEYIRTFVTNCLPPPPEWKSTVRFLQLFINDPQVVEWATSPAAVFSTSVTPEERRLRGAIMFGTVDLLRSGKRTAAKRWDDLPAETFYFEKAALFRAANAVQECTLLLLLEGTVSAVLGSRKIPAAQVSETLRRLHTKILSLLAGDFRLASLKSVVVSFLDDLLTNRSENVMAALTEAETNTVHATIEKMTNTDNKLYVTFERKVLNYFLHVLQRQPDPPLLGLVTNTAKAQAESLRKVLLFNWEVYSPFYVNTIPLLTFV